MKKFVGMLALAMFGASCAQELGPFEDAEGLAGDDESIVLASFALSNGNTIHMFGVPELDEIIVGENTPAGEGERFLVEDQPAEGPLELFTRLAPADTPVPRLIVELASDEERALLGQRAVVANQNVGEFFVDTAALGWAPVANKAGGSCAAGTGKGFFEDNHCGSMGPYGYGVTEIDCDSSASPSWQRSSAGKMRHTYSRTAACNGTGRIRHSRKKASGWFTILDEPIPANSVSTYYSYKKGAVKYYRRTRSERFHSSDGDAYVRQWARYFRQVTANAP